MSLLAGKKGLILNIANDRSIAAHIANNAVKNGAKCGFGFLPMENSEKSERRVRKAMEEFGFPSEWLFPCDVSRDENIDKFFAAAKEQFGTIDFLVHSLAFADRTYLSKNEGNFTSTPRQAFAQALDISAYSLIALARGAAALMPNGGSIIALSYLGAEKVIPGYNVMGVAKAALEASARYLAFDLGAKKIRVNTISAGPVRTLSAMAVGGIDEMFAHVERKASLKRNITGDEVGKTAVYLLSDLSDGVTGENIFVDGGFNTVGLSIFSIMRDDLIDKVSFIYPKDAASKIRGIVVAFHGLGDTSLKTQCTAEESAWAKAGVLIVDPALSPWSWMNQPSQRFVDELLDGVKARYRLPGDIPVVAVGGSMGGHAALLYSIVSRHRIGGCRAWVPVCDLMHHYGERPDLPRTMHVAFGSYDDLTEILKQHSPLHLSDRLRDVPYMIVQGDKDAAVKKEMHADKLVEAMLKRKLNVKYHVVANAEHGGPWPEKIVEEGFEFVLGCVNSK